MQTRASLIIPVENQVRELDPKLLLACIAAKAGFSSYIGSRLELDFRIQANALGGETVLDLRWARLNDGHYTLLPEPVAGADETDGMIWVQSEPRQEIKARVEMALGTWHPSAREMRVSQNRSGLLDWAGHYEGSKTGQSAVLWPTDGAGP